MTNVKEIMPLYSMVMVELYANNPYEKSTTDTGLRLTNDQFENPDTGELDHKEFYTATARVIEVGPKCIYAQKDDDVLVDLRTLKPIRFMGHTYFMTAEQNLTAVINEGLTERFNSIKTNGTDR